MSPSLARLLYDILKVVESTYQVWKESTSNLVTNYQRYDNASETLREIKSNDLEHREHLNSTLEKLSATRNKTGHIVVRSATDEQNDRLNDRLEGTVC